VALNRFAFFACIFLLAWAGFLWAYNGGPPPNRSGVNGTTCNTSGCHNDFMENSVTGSVGISGLPSGGWTAGQTYPLMVSVSHSGASLYGFQMTSVDSAGAQAGSFTLASGTFVNTAGAAGKLLQHIQHSFANPSPTFSFDWTAPSSLSVGDVRFNVAANAADGSFTRTGDFIYSTQQIVSAATTSSLTEVFYFPQIADGGVFTTTIFITNPGAVSTTANVEISFTSSAGSPLDIAFTDSAGQPFSGTVSFQLAGGQSKKLVSTGAGSTIQVGFAKVASDITVSGTAVFSQFDGSPATAPLLAEAGVGQATPSTRQAIFLDETDPFLTALAYAFPTSDTTATATLTFTLIDTSGNSIRTIQKTLAANMHAARFVWELFGFGSPDSLDDQVEVGTLQVASDFGVAVVSLRFHEKLFTSVPPFNLQ